MLVLGIAALLSAPALAKVFTRMSLRAAAHEIATVLQNAKLLALTDRADHGVKWTGSGESLALSIHRDGNGNGIRTADITKGIDRLVFGPIAAGKRYPKIRFSFVPGLPGRDPSGTEVGNLDDPIRFGQSNICTFTPTGTASPGSVYLSDGLERQALVRVSPLSGKIEVYEWCTARRTWVIAR